jgi:hypothetical protein
MRITKTYVLAFAAVTLLVFGHPQPANSADAYYVVHFDYPGSAKTQVGKINNRDQIVGSYTLPTEGWWHGFLKDGSSYSQIGPNDMAIRVWDINEAGHMVGDFREFDSNRHGFITYDGVEGTELNYPDAIATIAVGINNHDKIAGVYLDGDNYSHGYTYAGQIFSPPINYPGASYTDPYDINDRGTIVGYYSTLPNGSDFYRGFVFDGDSYTSIEYPGALWTFAQGINNMNVIVGSYSLDRTTYSPFIYRDGAYISLDLGPGSYDGMGINDDGDIVGNYTAPDGSLHGFLAVPITHMIQNAFINEVTALQRSGRLSSAQGQSLIDMASAVIKLL